MKIIKAIKGLLPKNEAQRAAEAKRNMERQLRAQGLSKAQAVTIASQLYRSQARK